MQILNLIIAIFVGMGFWKTYSKDQKKKTANASLTKTILLLLCTIVTLAFYLRTYDVAAFKNHINIRGIKGSYDIINDSIASHDVVKEIKVLNRFGYYSEEINDMWSKSGFNFEISLNNDSSYKTELYPYVRDDIDNYDKNSDYIYEISTFSKYINSIMPFRYINDSIRTDYYFSYVHNAKLNVEKNIINTLKHKDTLITSKYFNAEILYNQHAYDIKINSLINILKDSLWKEPNYLLHAAHYSENINKLNFFSAADLSQCICYIDVTSDIPVEKVTFIFDLPIQVTAMDVIKNNVTTNSFSVYPSVYPTGVVHYRRAYHISYPTLYNFQLIRSLIITTLLTALFSMFVSNFYYLCRKFRLKHLRNNLISYEKRKSMVMVLIPAGKIFFWSLAIVTFYLFVNSINDNHIVVVDYSVYYITLIISVLYFAVIYLFLDYIYKKKNVIPNFKNIIKKIAKKMEQKRKTEQNGTDK